MVEKQLLFEAMGNKNQKSQVNCLRSQSKRDFLGPQTGLYLIEKPMLY